MDSLGGGFLFFNFHPGFFGEMIQFDLRIFLNRLKPPTIQVGISLVTLVLSRL